MKLYIDPGTGSMLFAVLIGVFGAVSYLFRNWIVKLKFLISGGKKTEMANEKLPIVIFSDDKRYWSVFEPICKEFNSRNIDVIYKTASADDPALENNYEHIKAEFIGSNNKAFSHLNFLKAVIVLSTTPGLDVYQWKRSKDVDYYVHITHMANDITMYRMFGLDYYDAILLSGDYQIEDIRQLEEMRALKSKELVKVGIPYMDSLAERFSNAPHTNEERTVLLAPTWGKSSIFGKYGGGIISALLDTGYHIIVRPHPQSFESEKELMDRLMAEYPESASLEWNRDADNFDVLNRSDIMISDFSGVIFDFALVYDKPIIYTDFEIDRSVYDAWWLNKPLWTESVLPKIGKPLAYEDIDNIKSIIDECIDSTEYKEGRDLARNQTWCYEGEGAKRTVDYIFKKYQELTKPQGSE